MNFEFDMLSLLKLNILPINFALRQTLGSYKEDEMAPHSSNLVWPYGNFHSNDMDRIMSFFEESELLSVGPFHCD